MRPQNYEKQDLNPYRDLKGFFEKFYSSVHKATNDISFRFSSNGLTPKLEWFEDLQIEHLSIGNFMWEMYDFPEYSDFFGGVRIYFGDDSMTLVFPFTGMSRIEGVYQQPDVVLSEGADNELAYQILMRYCLGILRDNPVLMKYLVID